MRVLIAGCGYVGVALGLELVEAGHTVYGLRRSPEKLPPEIPPVAADLTQPSTLSGLPRDLDTVVYMASPGERSDAAYQAAYIDGQQHLTEALMAQERPPQRLLLVTSTAVYGNTDGAWVDESSPTEPTHFSGQRLIEAEALAASGPIPAVSVRLAGIYGPGRNRLIRNVASGKTLRTRAERYSNRIHREDCAGMLHHLLTHPSPETVYIGVDHAPVTLKEVYTWIAKRLGQEPPEIQPPENPTSGRGSSNKRCRNTRLLESGYVFRYPTFREGYGEMMDSMS